MLWWKKRKSCFDFFVEHSIEVQKAARLLVSLFDKNEASKELMGQIKALEHSADAIYHDVIKEMNVANFIPPLDREDILDFTQSLDQVINYIDDSASAFANIYALKEATASARQFADIIEKQSDLLVSACHLVRHPSKNSEELMRICMELHRYENRGDEIRSETLKHLYSDLSTQKIVIGEYLAWSDIYNTLEIVTDRAEQCGNIIEQIVLKYS